MPQQLEACLQPQRQTHETSSVKDTKTAASTHKTSNKIRCGVHARPGVTEALPSRRLTASLSRGKVPVMSMLVSVLERSQATRASLAVKPLAPHAEEGVREASDA